MHLGDASRVKASAQKSIDKLYFAFALALHLQVKQMNQARSFRKGDKETIY